VVESLIRLVGSHDLLLSICRLSTLRLEWKAMASEVESTFHRKQPSSSWKVERGKRIFKRVVLFLVSARPLTQLDSRVVLRIVRHWLEPRIDTVNYKGKGFMKTYWCDTKSSGRGGDSQVATTTSALDNLIDWSVGVLSDLLGEVILQRERAGSAVDCVRGSGGEPLGIQFPSTISNQLRDFVTLIAHQRQTNDSHGFELCCHVIMSINRLLDAMASQHCQGESPADKHDTLTSNALARLAMLFAALIQHVDHPTVDRGTNVAHPTATTDAWSLFTESRFADLRAFVFATELELERFHVAVATAALASRDHFCGSIHEPAAPSNGNGCRNSMANSVRNTETIALVMQASHAFHAMQHFSIYKKWSMVRVTKSRDASTRNQDAAAEDDPSTFWYEAELTFFDDLVIPLARTLQTCRLFGTVGDECIRYAQDNRTEWKLQGRDIVSGANLALMTSK
jgi:hypothetical protein